MNETAPPRHPIAVRRFAVIGALLGLGAPIGLLAVRYVYTHRELIQGWMDWELTTYGLYYIYTGVGSMLAMALWGVWSGRRVDAQRARADALEQKANRLSHLASTDGLTGVYVRRHLLEKLQEELRRAERYQTSVASLFVDVDNFKTFNETHGHGFGDEVLRQIARVIRKNVRESDVVGRYGGDEFLVMLPHARGREAMAAAERIRKGVERLEIKSPAGEPAPLTVSVGVIAEIPHRADVLRFLEIADQALQRSKGLGKNCTILCDTPLGEGHGAPS